MREHLISGAKVFQHFIQKLCITTTVNLHALSCIFRSLNAKSSLKNSQNFCYLFKTTNLESSSNAVCMNVEDGLSVARLPNQNDALTSWSEQVRSDALWPIVTLSA